MDITESFRTEDISKTDFFDFVIAPDNTQSFQSFTKQMRAVNVYLEDDNGDQKSEPNNNTLIIDQDHHTLNSSTLDVTNSSLNSSTISTPYDPLFWNCDKETVRLETAILEDLNKYCWSQDTTDTIVSNNINNVNSGNSSCDTANNNNNPKLLNNNTDGHIYTLTVLNGVEQTHWYRPPSTTLLSHQSIVKDDHDGSLPAPSPMEHIPQPQLDIDSILNIIPNGYNNNYDQQTLSPHNTVQLTTDGLIKSETFTYDDSGYADTKDEITNALMIDTPMLEAHDNFNNNNNDWKTDNNNSNNDNNNNNSNSNNNNNTNSNNTSGNTAESLLRSALQGKTFLRYQKKTLPESHTELRRALSTPPSKTDDLQPSATTNDHQMMTLQLSNNNIILFDNSNQITHHPESSTQSMDDLLLSQLDTTSYPVEDYEKLKHIANEVVESVQQYCQLDRVTVVDGNNIYVNASDLHSLGGGGGNNTEIIAPVTTTSSGATIIQTNINPSPPTTNLSTITTAIVTSSKSTTKKYKRTNSNSSTKQNTNNNMQTNVQTATSTSNGVRKERSLHYCSICSKGFKDKYSVNVHIRTHTGEKPFACSLCGKSFRQKAHLAKHYQTHIAQKNAAANSTNSNTGSNKKINSAIVTNNNNNNNNSTTNNKNNNSDTTTHSNNNSNSTIIVQSVTTPISINSISTSASVTCTPITPTTNVVTTSR